MSDLKTTFKKQGGFKLIKQYAKGGALFTCICQYLLLGKSRTGLEILRLSAHLKIKQRLEKKYKRKLIYFDKNIYKDAANTKAGNTDLSNKVWICWLQGIEKAPDIVKMCYASVCKSLSDKEIVLITEKNMEVYVEFPDYIKDKWKKGIITNAHLSDLLRIELLVKYGGTWIDATVFCPEGNVPDFYFDSELFFYQSLKPGRDGKTHINSSWFITGRKGNKMLSAVRYLLHEYWKKENYLVEYFLLHDFFAIVSEYYSEDYKNIIPLDNSTPHVLLLRLFDEYNEEMYKHIISRSAFHKLSYKFSKENENKENTYFKYLLDEYSDDINRVSG